MGVTRHIDWVYLIYCRIVIEYLSSELAEVEVVQSSPGVASHFASPKQLRELLLANLDLLAWCHVFAHWDQHSEAGDSVPLVAVGLFGQVEEFVLEVARLEVIGDVLVNALQVVLRLICHHLNWNSCSSASRRLCTIAVLT
jgi:hypothetical protein